MIRFWGAARQKSSLSRPSCSTPPIMKTTVSEEDHRRSLLLPARIAQPIIVCPIKSDGCYQAGIHHTRTDALIDALQASVVGRDDGREARVVAVVEQLEELLVGPGRALLRSQIIEDEQFRFAHLRKEMVIDLGCVGHIGRAQVIEQVADRIEENDRAILETLIGDGSRQVRLAT